MSPMTEGEYTRRYFNKVETMTAVCRTNSSWSHGDHPELEIGKTYHVSQIGVLKSSTIIRLAEFGNKEYPSIAFELFENGESIDRTYTKDPRFWAPYLRNRLRVSNSCYLADQIETIAIPAHLRAIEYEYNIKILFAVESGSRTWGFNSVNSDWDVRFIYVHKPEWYFRVEKQRDFIEHVYEDDVDMVGCELRTALILFRKSNPSQLEWLYSPKVYYKDPVFAMRIQEVEKDFFSPIKAMYHYNQIYIKQNELYIQKQGYPMKRFLYYLRGVLACKWIENNRTLPPVSFRELVDATVEDKAIRADIYGLIRLKRRGEEHDICIVDKRLVEYAQHLADYYNDKNDSYSRELNEASSDALDSILYDMVMAHS